MHKLVLDQEGRLVAVEGSELDFRQRGVVRTPGISLKRFVQAVREEFPDLLVEVHRDG